MNKHITKSYYLVLIFTFLLLYSCSQHKMKSKSLISFNATILIEGSKKPLSKTKVDLYIQTKPLFSMRGWKKVSSIITNQFGEFEFIIDKSETYQVRWNPENNVLPNTYVILNFEEKYMVTIIHKIGLYKKREYSSKTVI